MIKLIVGILLLLLFLYVASILWNMLKISFRQKDLMNVAIEEELADLEKEIGKRRTEVAAKKATKETENDNSGTTNAGNTENE